MYSHAFQSCSYNQSRVARPLSCFRAGVHVIAFSISGALISYTRSDNAPARKERSGHARLSCFQTPQKTVFFCFCRCFPLAQKTKIRGKATHSTLYALSYLEFQLHACISYDIQMAIANSQLALQLHKCIQLVAQLFSFCIILYVHVVYVIASIMIIIKKSSDKISHDQNS